MGMYKGIYTVETEMHLFPYNGISQTYRMLRKDYPGLEVLLRNVGAEDFVSAHAPFQMASHLIGGRRGIQVEVQVAGNYDPHVLQQCADAMGSFFLLSGRQPNS